MDNKHIDRQINYQRNMIVNSDDALARRVMSLGGGGLPPTDLYWRDDSNNTYTDDGGNPYTIDI